MNYFEGKQVTKFLEVCVERLKEKGELPHGFSLRASKQKEPLFWDRPGKLVGRTAQIEAVKERLQGHQDVLLYGGPGEGKTTILRHVGRELYEQGVYPGGAFEVDLTGEYVGV